MKCPPRPKKPTRSHHFIKNRSKYGYRNYKMEEDVLCFLRGSWDTNPRKLQRSPRQGDFIFEEAHLSALDWKSLRNVKTCICSLPFDHFTKKYHCWQCGFVFCVRCIEKHIILPGHLSQCAVPVCQPCYQKITYSSSENPS